MEQTRFNYYDILEVSPHSPQQEITTAYERARSTYTGENPAIYTMFSADEARQMLQMVEEAYSVLGNKTLRSIYDEKIGKGRSPSELSYESLKTESKIILNEPSGKKSSEAKVEYKKNPEFEAEYLSWTEWSGSEIKRVREYKNISIETMSKVTKINSYYIDAVEKMDTENLPAPVFVRGYVSQISKMLGVPEKTVCNSYFQKFKEVLEKK